ncbi:MAG: hypothetical protein SVP52_09035, partial [Chloroflexota bacterium]|nr:hypothetical protein [Chloroflexota bacterium]
PDGSDCGTGHAFCPYTIGTDTYCPYDSGVNSLGCADKIEIDVLSPTDIFTCYYDETARHYTINILGLVPLANSGETCPVDPADYYTHTLISREEAYNCACLYGSFTEVGVTAVELISFKAAPSQEGVLIEWETASEIDNLGFNLYREDLQTGLKVKINPELIPSKLPGSTQGAQYEFWDQAVIFGEPYAYWLEDIDLHMRVKDQYGPVIPLWWHFFLPILSVDR